MFYEGDLRPAPYILTTTLQEVYPSEVEGRFSLDMFFLICLII